MKEEKLKGLLEKYYHGNTSLEEEAELKKYFSGDEIFEGYEADKEIFRHYALSDKIPLPTDSFEQRIIKSVEDLEAKQRQVSFRKRYLLVIGAAAAIILMIGSYFFFQSQVVVKDTFTDPQLADAETMRILNEVSVELNKGTKALKPIGRMQYATRTSLSSMDRSAEIISRNMKKVKLLNQVSEYGDKENNRIIINKEKK